MFPSYEEYRAALKDEFFWKANEVYLLWAKRVPIEKARKILTERGRRIRMQRKRYLAPEGAELAIWAALIEACEHITRHRLEPETLAWVRPLEVKAKRAARAIRRPKGVVPLYEDDA